MREYPVRESNPYALAREEFRILCVYRFRQPDKMEVLKRGFCAARPERKPKSNGAE